LGAASLDFEAELEDGERADVDFAEGALEVVFLLDSLIRLVSEVVVRSVVAEADSLPPEVSARRPVVEAKTFVELFSDEAAVEFSS